LSVIEDAAHSLGAEYKGKPVGSLATMTIFSFHPVKLITTGEGGMVVTNHNDVITKLRMFRSHGTTKGEFTPLIEVEQAADNENIYSRGNKRESKSEWYYEMQLLGFNYRITDIQCALGLSQLKRIDQFLSRRKQIVCRYNEAFKENPLINTPNNSPDRKSAWHLYIIRLKLENREIARRRIFEELRKMNIGVHVHYIPLHLHPYYRKLYGHARGDFPVAEEFYDSALTLPLYPELRDDDCDRIIESVLKVVR
jgi:dTDP-4-amino-4,6-dideoxygalactose transaminase